MTSLDLHPDQYYQLGALVDESGYLQADKVAAPGSTTRIQRYVYQAADGSRQPCLPGIDGGVFRTYYDATLKNDCSLSNGEVGKYRCLPTPTMHTNMGGPLFSDATCTQPAAVHYLDPCAPTAPVPSYVVELTVADCGKTAVSRLFAHGPRLSTRYSKSQGTCAPDTSSDPSYDY
jgi:hypothetical protein